MNRVSSFLSWHVGACSFCANDVTCHEQQGHPQGAVTSAPDRNLLLDLYAFRLKSHDPRTISHRQFKLCSKGSRRDLNDRETVFRPVSHPPYRPIATATC